MPRKKGYKLTPEQIKKMQEGRARALMIKKKEKMAEDISHKMGIIPSAHLTKQKLTHEIEQTAQNIRSRALEGAKERAQEIELPRAESITLQTIPPKIIPLQHAEKKEKKLTRQELKKLIYSLNPNKKYYGFVPKTKQKNIEIKDPQLIEKQTKGRKIYLIRGHDGRGNLVQTFFNARERRRELGL